MSYNLYKVFKFNFISRSQISLVCNYVVSGVSPVASSANVYRPGGVFFDRYMIAAFSSSQTIRPYSTETGTWGGALLFSVWIYRNYFFRRDIVTLSWIVLLRGSCGQFFGSPFFHRSFRVWRWYLVRVSNPLCKVVVILVGILQDSVQTLAGSLDLFVRWSGTLLHLNKKFANNFLQSAKLYIDCGIFRKTSYLTTSDRFPRSSKIAHGSGTVYRAGNVWRTSTACIYINSKIQ